MALTRIEIARRYREKKRALRPTPPPETERRCSRCGETKALTEYHKDVQGRGGLAPKCKACQCELRRDHYRAKPLTSEQKTERAEYLKRYRIAQGDALLKKKRERYHRFRDERRPKRAEYARRRLAADPMYRLRCRVACLLRNSLKFGKQSRTTFDLLGYSLDELRTHLERQFLKGMSWGNMGDWHIDHIVPISSFIITSPDDPELRRAWALPNLRPLWAKENLTKSNKLVVLL